MVGRDLRDLSLPTETGMWVMAIRSGMDWRFDPGPDDVDLARATSCSSAAPRRA